MEILFVLIPLSILLIGLVAAILFWALRSGQYDDLERPRHQIFMDDDEPPGGDPEVRSGQGD